MVEIETKILTMENISKTFAGVTALKNARLDLYRGEVHALMGENGAGKSALMKILTGIHHRDSGEICFEGQPVTFKNPREARDAGIVMVHQELQMMNHLTVAQNIFIGRETTKYKWMLDDADSNRKAADLFRQLHMDLDPQTKVGNLTVGRQQLVEIAKAISVNAKIVVFDEPTAALTETETKELFHVIRGLKAKGIGIVYISHRMDEITEITDRVSVMRDGEYVATLRTKDATKNDIIDLMIGRVIYETPKLKSNVPPNAPVVLKVENLFVGDAVQGISFELRRGEILGFAGLIGAGRSETGRAIFGADPRKSGTILIKGKPVDIHTPRDAIRHGICYLSEDRKRYGVAVSLGIDDNIAMPNLKKYSKLGVVKENAIARDTELYCKNLRLKTASYKQKVFHLSGGNQQKVVIAKWLVRDSEILIFDEPTRGVDVGAKSEIYKLMNELVAQGKSIMMISSDQTEILRMSDRIIVMRAGRKTAELDISEASQEKILQYATHDSLIGRCDHTRNVQMKRERIDHE